MVYSSKSPLVTVGIPTFNRPEGLRRTLENITNQTYKNLEIIVSDNCSPTNDPDGIVKNFMQKDSRIIFHKQEKNLGPTLNFKFLLEKASGEYFMWAADDDRWELNYIERIINEFSNSDSSIVAINTEAQYTVHNGLQPFFSEGKLFYESYGNSLLERIMHILKYNYGNLMYSVFRISCLFKENKSIFSFTNNVSLNEIPLLIFVSQYGKFKIIPEVLFYKETNLNTYQQAKWEFEGGQIPFMSRIMNIDEMESTIRYHKDAFYDISIMISSININEEERIKIQTVLYEILTKHAINLIFSKKLLNDKNYELF